MQWNPVSQALADVDRVVQAMGCYLLVPDVPYALFEFIPYRSE